jgi:hypothetical protein
VRERALVALTQRIVTDGVGGIERFAQVRFVDRQSRPRGVAPDTGEAIGLQFDAH